MNIIFEHPTIRKDISSKEVHTEIFKGHNVGKPVTIKSSRTSCPCTTVDYPKGEIRGQFDVIVKVDKRNKEGFYSQSVTLMFSTGQEIKLTISGKII